MGCANSVEALILRFRDGIASSSNTIDEHQSIIADKKYVWWGWWAKPQETVAAAAFSSICVKIRGGHKQEIYLFDSGTLLLYRANCVGIEYGNDKSSLLSPDPDATPAYYSKDMYIAWFKFTSIEICDADILKEYSYVDLDEFYVDGSSQFHVFDNKMVFGTDELHGQQKTMWFVRKKQVSDKSHEIKSFMQPGSVAASIDRTFKVLPCGDILWLSDLHFSQEHHAFTITETENNSLFTRLSEILAKEKINPSAVIISGDITFKALEDEYKQAEEFIKNLNSVYSLDGSSYAITPGNHDLAFSDSPDKIDSIITKTYQDAKKNYNSFYGKVFGCAPTDELYSIRRFLTPDLVPVEIICLNSCYLQQCKDAFQGLGYVGANQLQAIKKELDLTAYGHPIRILVMHHHIMPVVYKESPQYNTAYSLMLDAEAVVQFICENNIHAIFHGHNHKEFYAEVIRKVKNCKKKFYTIGLGSCGVKTEELTDGRQNMFAMISIEKTSMTIRGLSISPTGEEYKELFRHEIPIIEEKKNV